MRQIVVNAVTPWVQEAMLDLGVNAVRSVPACVCVAILIGLSGTSGAVAASISYSTSTSQSPQMSRVTTTQTSQTKPYSPAPQTSSVPPNCILQSCGTLYCWKMKH